MKTKKKSIHTIENEQVKYLCINEDKSKAHQTRLKERCNLHTYHDDRNLDISHYHFWEEGGRRRNQNSYSKLQRQYKDGKKTFWIPIFWSDFQFGHQVSQLSFSPYIF